MSTSASRITRTRAPDRELGEPAWEVARLFPAQGAWTEEEYLELRGNHLVEFSNGFIEVPPMPTFSHQLIVLAFYEALKLFAQARKLGTVVVAPLRVRLWKGQYREPDIVFMLAKNAERMGEEYWRGADLVVEVVSGNAEARRRDLKTKRAEYARARIAEYWIVDAEKSRITVLRRSGRRYLVHGEFGRGKQATSALLNGFSVDVDTVLKVK